MKPDTWTTELSIPVREITPEELVEKYPRPGDDDDCPCCTEPDDEGFEVEPEPAWTTDTAKGLPRTRAEVDAALQVPPTPEEREQWDRAFRDTATPKMKEAWEAKLDGYELRPTAYIGESPRGSRMSGKAEALRLIDEMQEEVSQLMHNARPGSPLTEQQVRDLQAANARQVRDEWIAAGRPGERPVVAGPLRVRFELAPGFGLSWLSLLACCGALAGVVDAKLIAREPPL